MAIPLDAIALASSVRHPHAALACLVAKSATPSSGLEAAAGEIACAYRSISLVQSLTEKHFAFHLAQISEADRIIVPGYSGTIRHQVTK
jgi:hypothetical protein